MFDLSKSSTSEQERTILKKLRIWIAALAVACLVAGIGIGAMLSGRPTVAQPEIQVARAPEALSASFAEIARRVEPAVVNIETTQNQPEVSEKDEDKEDQSTNNPLLDMFRRQRRPTRGVGSGFIVSPKGYILTNHHVIDGAEQIKVDLNDNRTLDARLIGSDPPSDLAVLKIDATNLPVLALGDSDKVRVGDVVLAIGNPMGIGQTVTMGIISAKGRQTGMQGSGSFEDFLQTDAPINQGNSGGALVSTNSELIGINSQILSPSGGSIGIGFAIPSNMARTVADTLVKNGKVRRGQLGIIVGNVTSEVAAELKLKEAKGLFVREVQPGSGAERAGLRRNDVIRSLNGSEVSDANVFRNQIASTQPGTDVLLTIVRDGREQQITAKLGEYSPPVERARE